MQNFSAFQQAPVEAHSPSKNQESESLERFFASSQWQELTSA